MINFDLWLDETSIEFYQEQIELAERFLDQGDPPWGFKYWLGHMERMERKKDITKVSIDKAKTKPETAQSDLA